MSTIKPIQRFPLTLMKWLSDERTESQQISLALNHLPRRRSIVSSSLSITGPCGTKASIISSNRMRLSVRGHHAARLRMRWTFTNRRSCAVHDPQDAGYRALPGVRIAPINRT
ncbi:hypothetical protein [Methylobacterium sp. V23]|uniref:hypothetical protein n=1 Tax=Methylobacterium sp. V23 TaxID=2044878 RepID=UPI000CDB5F52|nr:hypothetical protein [Methylobacterium sp. V23]POR39936.1 hypothetical protein CRT23_26695 [Methylobacterium sp. V23]